MNRLTQIIVGGLVALALSPIPAFPQGIPCGDRAQIVKQLEEQYKEKRVWVGLQNQNAAVELYRSESGSWTLLLTRVDGTSCIVSVGETSSLGDNTPEF